MTPLKTLLFTLVIPGSVTVLVPYLLLSSGAAAQPGVPRGVRLVGAILIALGASLYGRCAWDFTFVGGGTPGAWDQPKVFVATGLYRFVRNPMYVGVCLILIGEAIAFGSRKLLAYAAVVWSIFHMFVVFYEEPTLARKFGETYENYCRTVPRWIPARPR